MILDFRKAARRFVDSFPQFAKEIETLLLASKEPHLATQIPELLITRRCDCEDDFCATFYTLADRYALYRADTHCVNLDPQRGQIVIDVVYGRITGVEVLFRDDVRGRLRALFP